MLRLCPQCRIPLADQGCPRCGYQPHGTRKPAETEKPSVTPQPPIQFDVVVSSESAATSERLDWKAELKRKLDERAEKPEVEARPEPEQEQEPASKTEERQDEVPTKLFRYKLDQALRNSTHENSSASAKRKVSPPVFQKPLVRQKPVRPLAQPPGQQSLRLKPGGSVVEKIESEVEGKRPIEEEPRISKEVLFSRLLSGIVDLFLPVLLGTAFTVVASLLLDFDLFYAGSVKWIALFALSFFLFNSLFFLLTSGQTPGMIATDLHLVGETEEEDLSATAVVIRVFFFLPSAMTVVGLAWAIFDPLCRCFHDLVSRTRVVPGR